MYGACVVVCVSNYSGISDTVQRYLGPVISLRAQTEHCVFLSVRECVFHGGGSSLRRDADIDKERAAEAEIWQALCVCVGRRRTRGNVLTGTGHYTSRWRGRTLKRNGLDGAKKTTQKKNKSAHTLGSTR